VDPDLLDVLDLHPSFPERGEESRRDTRGILAAHGHQMGKAGWHADLTVLAPVRPLQPPSVRGRIRAR
jgi:hypothetical protein